MDSKKYAVGFVGDGINDAPSIKEVILVLVWEVWEVILLLKMLILL